jgi:predicted permease
METLWQDVRYTVRLLRKQPGFSLVAILTLALGIGASTAIFSVIDAALLRPLPYPNPEQLVDVNVAAVRPDGSTSSPMPSMDDLRHWESNDEVFSSVAGWGRAPYGVVAGGAEPERVSTYDITEDYLALHGVAPLIGRDFSLYDLRTAAHPVVMLGHGYWQRRFGGRDDVIGETIRYDDTVATIVGVAPPGFYADTPLFRPLQIRPDWVSLRGTGRVSVIGRLRPGLTIEQATERLSAAMPPLILRDGSQREVRVELRSRLDSTIGRYETTVFVLSGAVGLILLIACVNVAGLLLGRGAVRQSELAVRASLGAGRLRIVRQLLTESVVLASAGGAAGLLIAWLSLDALVANIPMALPDNAPVRLNGTVLTATAGLAVATALVFGLMPAIRLSRVDLSPTLARAGRRHGSALSRRGGQFMIAAEVALAVVLMAGAGLMIRSFARIAAVDLGFDPDGLVTMEVTVLEPTAEAERAYYVQLLRAIRAIQGVDAVGGINNFHLGGSTTYSSVQANGESTGANPFEILPGYFEALGLRVRQGRLPTDVDYAAAARFVVLSEKAARAIFPDGAAAGREVRRPGEDEPFTVAAVVADVRHGGPFGDVERVTNQVYFPLTPAEAYQERARSSNFVPPPARATTVVLRTLQRIPDLAGRLRRTAESIGPRVLVERVRTGNDWFGDRVVTPRRRTVLLSLLGGLGLVLAVVGVFGMTAYAVSRRTQEIGVRLVFGASPGEVVGRMLRDSAIPVLLGASVGLAGAALATRAIASFLFETDPIDAPTFAVVALVLVTAGCLAAWLPARRAALVDPVTALRAE